MKNCYQSPWIDQLRWQNRGSAISGKSCDLSVLERQREQGYWEKRWDTKNGERSKERRRNGGVTVKVERVSRVCRLDLDTDTLVFSDSVRYQIWGTCPH